MSINDITTNELATQRKITSDKKNQTDDLSFKNREQPSSHGRAYSIIRQKNDAKAMSALYQTDEEYLLELGSDF